VVKAREIKKIIGTEHKLEQERNMQMFLNLN
jgi:hypothetical protein